MALPCLKNARRIFAIVSTTSIPTSASKNHGSQCGPSVPGSRLEADHPERGVLFACRFTDVEHFGHVADSVLFGGCSDYPFTRSPRRQARAASLALQGRGPWQSST